LLDFQIVLITFALFSFYLDIQLITKNIRKFNALFWPFGTLFQNLLIKKKAPHSRRALYRIATLERNN